ncbi:hypothetical protein BH23BAC4_BH23BAC4_05250 [soil metagenome]
MSQVDFTERLKALFARKPGSQEDLRRRNRYAMGVSVLIATMLWFTVSMREIYTVSVDAPLFVRSLPEGQALREPVPETVEVQYQGEGWHLLGLRRQPPPIDVHASTASVNLLRAASETARLPPGVGVLSVTPSNMDLNLEQRAAIMVPVRLRGEILPQPPYALSAPPRIQPDSIIVVGAVSILGQLEYWPTEPLVRRGIDDAFTIVVPLVDSLAGLVSLGTREVRVTVPVEEYTEGSRELEIRVDGLPPEGARIRLVPDRLRVTFRAPVAGGRFRAAQTSPGFYAFVSYADIMADTTGSIPVVLNLPPNVGVRDARFSPRRIGYYTVRD